MALVFTHAGLQAELEAFNVALKARDWNLALDEANDYANVYRGLFESGTANGSSVKLHGNNFVSGTNRSMCFPTACAPDMPYRESTHQTACKPERAAAFR